MAIEILTSNHWNGREGYTPKFIVLHGTAGGSSAQNIATYFQSTEGTDNPVSVNDIIGQDGTRAISVRDTDAAYGNGVLSAGHDAFWDKYPNPNLVSLSIEHVKTSTDNSDPLTPAQQQTSFELIKEYCDKYNIPKRWADASGGITGHFSIDPVDRSLCPNTYPWDALWAFLSPPVQVVEEDVFNPIEVTQVSGYYEQTDSNHWKCKQNGFVVQYAILNFYRVFGKDALAGLTYLGLPKSNEVRVPNTKVAVTQDYERATVVYDPNHEVDRPPASGAVYLKHIR